MASMEFDTDFSGYELLVVRNGFSRPHTNSKDGSIDTHAKCSITLIKGPTTVLIDPGSPWDKEELIVALATHRVSLESVQYVICTHGHIDHIGNVNLFPAAIHILGFDLCRPGDIYLKHDFAAGIPYEIDDNLEVWPTPGHMGHDVSVFVKGTQYGTVCVAGDLFECQADLENPALWQENSENCEVQERSRSTVLSIADFIVPGHGPMFKVPLKYKVPEEL